MEISKFRKIAKAFLVILLSMCMYHPLFVESALNDYRLIDLRVDGKLEYDVAFKILTKLNQLRNSKGLSTLTMDKELMNVSMLRGAENVIDFSHMRPDGTVCFTASSKAMGENIAFRGYDDPFLAENLFLQWRNSSSHYKTMINPMYNSVGIGVFVVDGYVYAVQTFGTDKAIKVSKSQNILKAYLVRTSTVGLKLKQPDRIVLNKNIRTYNAKFSIYNRGNNITIYNAPSSSVKYTIKDPNIAIVDSRGTVFGKSIGKTTLTMSLKNYPKVTVKQDIIVDYVNRNKAIQKINNVSSTYRKTYQTAFSIKPKASGKGLLSYKSSNTKIVTVNSSGKITPKGIGTATITINANETADYKACMKKITVTIMPLKENITSIKVDTSKKMILKWKKDSKATGYQIQYATKKSFANQKTVNVTKNSITSKTIVSLQKGKVYYVRVRSYKKIGSKNFYGDYSVVRSLKVK